MSKLNRFIHVRGEGDKESREIEFVISTEDVDRHNSIIKMDAWDISNYNRNGIVAYQHNTSSFLGDDNPDYILGSGRAYKEGNQLIGVVKFEPAEVNPLAEKIYQKILHGTLKAASVGFNPKERIRQGIEERGEDPNVNYFDQVELLEFSVVNIPSNYNALKRSFDEDFEKYLKENKKKKRGLGLVAMARAKLNLLKNNANEI